jgi:hypothetical protein
MIEVLTMPKKTSHKEKRHGRTAIMAADAFQAVPNRYSVRPLSTKVRALKLHPRVCISITLPGLTDAEWVPKAVKLSRPFELHLRVCRSIMFPGLTDCRGRIGEDHMCV